jgi:hypothetical protein
LQKEGDSLKKQEQEIKTRTASPAKSKAEWSANQALIDAYNANVAQFQHKRSLLLGEQESLNQSVSTHNTAVEHLNQRGNAYNASNDEFGSQVSALVSRSQSHLANCSGEKTLRESPNP